MRAERKSPATIASCSEGVLAFPRWANAAGVGPETTKTAAQAFTADLLDNGAQAATARARHTALHRFAAWLADEGELEANPLLGVKPPKLDAKVVDALTDEQLLLLIKGLRGQGTDRPPRRSHHATDGRDRPARRGSYRHAGGRRRPSARAIVRGGMGGKGRAVPFGPQTAAAVDRYMRARRTHRLISTGALWLCGNGQTFSYHGLNFALKRRAKAAGITGFHLYLMRHTAATRWLRPAAPKAD